MHAEKRWWDAALPYYSPHHAPRLLTFPSLPPCTWFVREDESPREKTVRPGHETSQPPATVTDARSPRSTGVRLRVGGYGRGLANG